VVLSALWERIDVRNREIVKLTARIGARRLST
jgi:hypothetical protein